MHHARAGKPGGRHVTCEVCGTGVYPDDALGAVDGRVTHAECALVRWLGSHSRRSVANGNDERTPAAFDEWLEVFEPLLGRRS